LSNIQILSEAVNMNEKSKKSTQNNKIISKTIQESVLAEVALLPEHSAVNAIKAFAFDPNSSLGIDSVDLIKELIEQSKAIEEGDLTKIERYLYSQAIALDSLFKKMIAQISGTNYINQLQIYTSLALKAQNQCRSTLETLARIKTPNQTTFIKQQNNAVAQQVNPSPLPEKPKNFENPANELLNERIYETLDDRRPHQAIEVNPQMETMATFDRSKNA
jgi:hypothetical protein